MTKLAKIQDNKIQVNLKDKSKTIKELYGIRDEALCLFVNKIVNVFPGLSKENVKEFADISLHMIEDLKPKDAIETMLISQLIGTYNLSMAFMSRSQKENLSTELIDKNIERATKLMRTFTAQMEALTRYQTKGQQKMIIKRVNVNAGAQAVIGNIQDKGGEGNNKI
jgi:hypothetical protein